MAAFPTDDQTLGLLQAALNPGPDADRTSVNDLIELYGDMAGTSFHVNDVLGALLAEVVAHRALAGPTMLAVARGRREAYAAARTELRNELRGAPGNAPPQSQLTYVGGLARARRMLERLYQGALADEERLVLGSAERGPA